MDMSVDARWQCVIVGEFANDYMLYRTLTELLIACKSSSISSFFPAEAAQTLLSLLDKHHEPQVYLVTCALIGCLCNVSASSKEQLVRRGVLSSLASVLKVAIADCNNTSKTLSSPAQHLVSLLVEYVTSMFVYFSSGPNICVQKLLRPDTLSVLASLVDHSAMGLFSNSVDSAAAAATVLRSLTEDKILVGWRVEVSDDIPYEALHGATPYVVDVYDTSGDDDVHVVDELEKQCEEDSVWRCDGEDDNGTLVDDTVTDDEQWVDVKVCHVIDGLHFWAVLGASDINCFNELCQRLEVVVDASKSFDTVPSVGQIVCAKTLQVGWYRARVVSVCDCDTVRVFAMDYGFSETVCWAQLKTLDKSLHETPTLVHWCKLAGVRRIFANERVAENVLTTLCNVAAADKLLACLIASQSDYMQTIEQVIRQLNYLTTYPKVDIQLIVLRTFVNLVRVDTLRTVVVESGMLTCVLDVIKMCMSHGDNCSLLTSLKCCLSILRNVLNSDVNRIRLKQLQGVETLIEVAGMQVRDDVHVAICAVLRMYVGPCDTRLTEFDITTLLPTAQVESVPKVDLRLLLGQSAADGELLADSATDGDLSTSFDISALDAIKYVLNTQVFVANPNFCELRSEKVEDMPNDIICKLLCGFINTRFGGRICFGLSELNDKVSVVGVVMTHEKRDKLRLCVDKLVVNNISPRLVPQTVCVHFHPVFDSKDLDNALTDLYVVEIVIKKPTCLQWTLYTVSVRGQDPKSYIYRQGLTHQMSPTEVYQWTLQTVEGSKVAAIDKLKQQIEQLSAVTGLTLEL